MTAAVRPSIDTVGLVFALLLFLTGLFCLTTRRNVVRQVIGLKIMLQGVALSLVLAGRLHGDTWLAQAMVVSALVVETMVIAVALAFIVNAYLFYPSGDVDHLNRLRG